MLGKALTDPVWFFITDWFAIYLVSKGFKLENTLIGFWVPFLAADLGNFAGGGLPATAFEGWPVLRARKLVVLLGGIGMTLLIPTISFRISRSSSGCSPSRRFPTRRGPPWV